MIRRWVIGFVALLGMALWVAGPVLAQGGGETAICPDDTMNWLVPTQGALQAGASLNCRATPADMVWAIPQNPPDGYAYAYSAGDGYAYYDVTVFGGDLSGPIDVCIRGVPGVAGQTLAVWAGTPNQWFLLPSFRSGDSVCAQSERVGGITLLRATGEFDLDAGVDMSDIAPPASSAGSTTSAAAPTPAVVPDTSASTSGASSGGTDLTIVAPGTEETCIVRTKYIVRLRSEPNTSSEILDLVPWRSPMLSDLVLTNGEWMRVNYLGQLGWIHTRFLEQSANCAGLNQIAP